MTNAFRGVFQGGDFVEVFSPVKKDLMSNAFISENMKKVYDKLAKTYVYVLDGESTEMQLVIPKNSKKSLGLIQPYLVLQLFVTEDKGFRFELAVSCATGCRKRIAFSNNKRSSVKVSALSASLPFNLCHKEAWMHVCISINEIVSTLWNEKHKTIDAISLGGSCGVRQIYTIHKNIINGKENSKSWEMKYISLLPKQCNFPLNVSQVYHLISKNYLQSDVCNSQSQPNSRSDSASSKSSLNSVSRSKKGFKNVSQDSLSSRGSELEKGKDDETEGSHFDECLKVVPIRSPPCLSAVTNGLFDKTVVFQRSAVADVSGPQIDVEAPQTDYEAGDSQVDEAGDSQVDKAGDNQVDEADFSQKFSSLRLTEKSSPNDTEEELFSSDKDSSVEDNSDSSSKRYVDVWFPSLSRPIGDALSLARNLVRMEGYKLENEYSDSHQLGDNCT